jgi:hypothetical protein
MAMKVTMLLADSAHVAYGKLYVWGGGWSVMGPGPTSMSIVMRIEVPPDQTGIDHVWQLQLVDEDGRAVMCADHGVHPIQRSGVFHTHPMQGSRPGVPADFVLAVDAGVIAVPPGGRYVWIATIDDETSEDWQLSFTSRANFEPRDSDPGA